MIILFRIFALYFTAAVGSKLNVQANYYNRESGIHTGRWLGSFVLTVAPLCGHLNLKTVNFFGYSFAPGY